MAGQTVSADSLKAERTKREVKGEGKPSLVMLHVGALAYSFTVEITILMMVHILLIHSSHFYCFSMLLLGDRILRNAICRNVLNFCFVDVTVFKPLTELMMDYHNFALCNCCTLLFFAVLTSCCFSVYLLHAVNPLTHLHDSS